MGLSRNKVAVPEGAAGTPPFWSTYIKHGAKDKKRGHGYKERFSTIAWHYTFLNYETIYRNNSTTAGSEVRAPPYSTSDVHLYITSIFDILKPTNFKKANLLAKNRNQLKVYQPTTMLKHCQRVERK